MRFLHIGGEEHNVHEKWEMFNIIDADWVDHVGNANDMSRFEDETFDKIYASHILEHFDYRREIQKTLKEWCRILKKGGKLYIAMPNMDKLCKMFLDKENVGIEDRIQVMRFMLGGHLDEYDYHKIALDRDMLFALLWENGFKKIWQVAEFNFFQDNSAGVWQNHTGLSLNMVAEREK